MHGTLRFLLAALVALSHFGVSLPNFNQGVTAVVIFYMLAGMVSYKLITNQFSNQPLSYYKNRFMRIYPLYFLTLLFAFFIYLIGAKSAFISSTPNIADYLANLTIIPLAYYMYTGQDSFTLIPPAWSLGVELQFYLLAPFIITNKKKLYIFLSISLSIYILATFGTINTDIYGYRHIAGVLSIFLLGVLLQKALQDDREAKIIIALIHLTAVISLALLYMYDLKAPYNYETLSGIIIALPLLLFIKKTPFVSSRIDKYLGSLSYALFLIHFPTLWLSQMLGYEVNAYTLLSLTFLLSSLLLIFTSMLFTSKNSVN